MLFDNEWELTKSPAGANQWVAKDVGEIFPDAFDSEKRHRPTMLTTDLSLRFDPIYEKLQFQDKHIFNIFQVLHKPFLCLECGQHFHETRIVSCLQSE